MKADRISINRKVARLFLLIALLLLGTASLAVGGGTFEIKKHASMAPSSIPVPQSGTSLIGMSELEVCSQATVGAGPNYSVSQMQVTLTKTGSFTNTDILSVKVYFETHGLNGVYDNQSPALDDVLVGSLGSLGSEPFGAGVSVTVPIDPTKNTVDDVGNGNDHFYVVFELKAGALASADSLGCEIGQLTYGNAGVGTGNTKPAPTAHGIQKPVDGYLVTLAASGIVINAEEYQGATNVPVLKATFTPTDTDASTKISLGTLKVHTRGTRDADLTAGGVILYEDTNLNGTFEAGSDTQVTFATLGTPSAGYATLTPSSPVAVGSAGKTFFVAVNLATSAIVGDTVGLEIQNPASDVTFADVIADEQPGPNYANVAVGYSQLGYLTGTTATPAAGNTFTVKLQVVPQNPIVFSIVPGNNATGVLRSATVQATFSKPMNAATINSNTFKLFDGATQVNGAVAYDSGTYTVTFTPASLLDWSKTYTAIVYGDGSSGVQDSVDSLYMQANKVWNFTTVFAVYPTILNSYPTSNQIEVPRDALMSAVFSKDMDVASLESPATAFTVFDGAVYITGNVTYNAGNRTATFTPSSNLDWGKTYTATVSTAAHDIEDLALQNDRVWMFTTTMPVYPYVASTTPTNGATEVARTATVTALFSKPMVAASVEGAFSLRDSGSNLVGGSAVYNPGTQTLTFTPSADLAWGMTYTARITTAATDSDGLVMQSDKVWTFTTTMPLYPVVTSSSPANGATEVARTSTVSALFSKDMVGASVEGAFSLKDADTNPVSGTAAYDVGSKTLTFTPDSDLAWGMTYTARIITAATATDGLALQADKVWTFTTTMPIYPVVLTRSPAHGATEVARSTTVHATFSRDMDPTTISVSTVTLAAGASPIAGAVTWDGPSKTATFTPAAALGWGITYTVTVVGGASGVKSTDGLAMQANNTWTFTSVMPVYPAVLSKSPADGSTEVPRATAVTVTFSKDMDPASLAASFNLRHGVTTDTVSMSYDGLTRTATFTPSAILEWNTVYTATVSTGATDLDGLSLQSSKVWTFTTTVDVKPVVTNTDPANGMESVLPDENITATFSKPMNPATITSATFQVKDEGAVTVTGVISFPDAWTAIFNPDSDLQPGTRYAVTIVSGAAGVKDTDALSMSADKVWSFRVSNRPAVLSVTPPTGASGVATGAVITATFSKDIDPATIVSPANTFSLWSGGSAVPGTVTYNSATFTATFTPASPLSYAQYSVVISTAVEDPDGIAMAAAKTWTFTTIPVLAEPIAANNRIVPGGKQQVMIFLTEPPAGSTDKMTVQVFTATGRRIATLISGRSFASITSPLIWDGTNGAGQKLAPGLYYIQIQATGYKRVLKALIVR